MKSLAMALISVACIAGVVVLTALNVPLINAGDESNYYDFVQALCAGALLTGIGTILVDD